MGLKDLLLVPFYVIIVFAIASRLFRKHKHDKELKKWYRLGLYAKLSGAFIFLAIYQFYYGGGDTFGFFGGASAYTQYLLNEPGQAISFLFENNFQHLSSLYHYNPTPEYNYILRGNAELALVKIAGFINLFALNSFLITTLLFGFISFTGSWLMYRVFITLFPDRRLLKPLAIAILFLPSVVFWGSGLMKDTLTFAATGWLVYSVFNVFIVRKISLSLILLLIISASIIAYLKGYILLGLIPALTFWVVLSIKSKIPSRFFRMIITPFLILVTVGLGSVLINQISDELGRFSLENLEQTTEGFHNWHQVASGEEGSGYTLGTPEFTPSSMLRKFPAAVNVTFFRPYLWEAKNIVTLMTAVESLLFFCFFLLILFKSYIIRFFTIVLADPTLIFCLMFALVFGFEVGYTSYNFGALARYKIPCMPFFASMLVIVYYRIKYKEI